MNLRPRTVSFLVEIDVERRGEEVYGGSDLFVCQEYLVHVPRMSLVFQELRGAKIISSGE